MNRSFCTVINCIDGRVQIPVINYLKDRFNVAYVDSVTEVAPNRIVGRESDDILLASIINRVKISVTHHSSVGLAIVAHYDCAGNPAGKTEQLEDIELGVKYLTTQFEKIPVIGLWVNEKWEVSEVFMHT